MTSLSFSGSVGGGWDEARDGLLHKIEGADCQGPVHAMTLHLHEPESEHPLHCILLVFLVSVSSWPWARLELTQVWELVEKPDQSIVVT